MSKANKEYGARVESNTYTNIDDATIEQYLPELAKQRRKPLRRFLNFWYLKLFKNPSVAVQLLFYYAFFTFVIGTLLWMPFTLENGVSIKYIDAMFTSASAISDTGLTTVDASSTWNRIGEALIMIEIIIGGIGWFAIKIFIINLVIFGKVKFRAHEQAKERFGTVAVEQTRGIIKTAVFSSIIMIMIFGPIFGIMFATVPPKLPEGWQTAYDTGMNFATTHGYDPETIANMPQYYVPDWTVTDPGWEWGDATVTYKGSNPFVWYGSNPNSDVAWEINTYYSMPNLYHNWDQAMWNGFFIAASAINNAGFDLLNGSVSLTAYYGNYTIQLFIMFLFIFGGTGFAVIYDCWQWFRNRSTGHRFKFSVATKVSLIAYWSIALTGLAFAYTAEWTEALVNPETSFLLDETNGWGTLFQKHFAIFFNTFSTRNAGFSTMMIQDLSNGTLLVFSGLMFIGSGPGSTAGGIRTTTAAVIVWSMWAHMRGKNEVVMFGRKVSNQQVKESFTIFIISFVIVALLTLEMTLVGVELLNATNGVDLVDFIFVSCSAYGTTGMATYDLGQLSSSTKLFILLTMFLGQLGAGTFMKSFKSKKFERSHINHIEETITF